MSQKPQFVPITKIMNLTGNLIHKFQMDDLNHIQLIITRVPRPVPREISSIVDVREILEVNEDYKTMTVSLYLIMEWHDPQINILGPEEIKYRIPQFAETCQNTDLIFEGLELGFKLKQTLPRKYGLQTSISLNSLTKVLLSWQAKVGGNMNFG